MRVVAESGRPLKKGALKILIGSVALSALLGVFSLVTSEFGEGQAKVLFTAMTVAGASIIVLACGAALELGRAGHYAPVGIWSSVIGALLVIGGIWLEVRDDGYWRAAVSVTMIAFFSGHASALSAANLLPRHAWLRAATIALTAVLLLLLLTFVWQDDGWLDFPWRLAGVLIVLASAGTILVPVLARMGRDEFQVSADAFGALDDEDIEPDAPASAGALPRCPHCGEALPASLKKAFP
jgi:hypothetical protein